jgi:uracil-DNA glycosylase family 4
MQFESLSALNEQIKSCNKCEIDANKCGFEKTLGAGAVNDVKIFFVCQKPHILSEKTASLDQLKVLWKKYRPMYFTYNLKFYDCLNEAELLGEKEETEKKLNELRSISITDIHRWWKVRGEVCRELLKDNGLYITEAVKCPTNGNRPNRGPKIDEIRNCREHLLSEIETLNPKLICTLGKDAAKALVDTKIELKEGVAYSIWGRTVFHTYFPGQYGGRAGLRVDNALRIKNFSKLKSKLEQIVQSEKANTQTA